MVVADVMLARLPAFLFILLIAAVAGTDWWTGGITGGAAPRSGFCPFFLAIRTTGVWAQPLGPARASAS